MARTLVLAVIFFMAIPALACNLAGTPAGTETPVPPTESVSDGTRPAVTIESPANGSQAVVRQPFSVRVRATDTKGIDRVVMRDRSANRVVGTQPSPEPSQNFEALLQFTPNSAGPLTLEVIAYRGGTASDPATVTIDVVSSQNELRNPGSLDPTAGVASGSVICTARANVNNLNLRTGPATSYQSLGKLALGEELTVIGRNGDTTWLQVRLQGLPGAQQEGWVFASYIQTNGDCTRAPIVNPGTP